MEQIQISMSDRAHEWCFVVDLSVRRVLPRTYDTFTDELAVCE